MDKVKKNYFIYILYQAVLLSFPLITFPYVSGALGVNNYGIYNYSFTIVTYFLIFARLGIFNYGAREIAENNLSRERLTKSFRNIFVVQFILTSIILLIYVSEVSSFSSFGVSAASARRFITPIIFLSAWG